MSTNQLNKIPENIGWYLSGFCDGEGSLNVSLRKKEDYKNGWQPVLSFNVSQKDITILAMLKRYFACGIIKKRKDGLFSFDVTNPNAISQNVIPFFKKFQFLSASKKYNFRIFKEISNLMIEKRHLDKEGLTNILKLREKLNPGRGRKRKYNISNINLN